MAAKSVDKGLLGIQRMVSHASRGFASYIVDVGEGSQSVIKGQETVNGGYTQGILTSTGVL
jgi:hypothetical protein